MTSPLSLSCVHADGTTETLSLAIDHLVIAGWTGRDQAAMLAHMEELEALGIARPTSTPVFYRVAADLLTVAPAIQVSGDHSSGEVETIIFTHQGRRYVGLGSDHTDRKAEAINVSLSKQMCHKPVAPTCWAWDDVAPHWDQLQLRAWAHRDGARVPYQDGLVSAMKHPDDLLTGYEQAGNRPLTTGAAMFGGTLAVIGAIAGADRFEIALQDPVLGRSIQHAYDIERLPVAG